MGTSLEELNTDREERKEQNDKEIKIRKRKSYLMFVEFYEAGARREVLELLNHELNKRSAYGSNTAALYARESLNLFILDFKI